MRPADRVSSSMEHEGAIRKFSSDSLRQTLSQKLCSPIYGVGSNTKEKKLPWSYQRCECEPLTKLLAAPSAPEQLSC